MAKNENACFCGCSKSGRFWITLSTWYISLKLFLSIAEWQHPKVDEAFHFYLPFCVSRCRWAKKGKNQFGKLLQHNTFVRCAASLLFMCLVNVYSRFSSFLHINSEYWLSNACTTSACYRLWIHFCAPSFRELNVWRHLQNRNWISVESIVLCFCSSAECANPIGWAAWYRSVLTDAKQQQKQFY